MLLVGALSRRGCTVLRFNSSSNKHCLWVKGSLLTQNEGLPYFFKPRNERALGCKVDPEAELIPNLLV